MPAEIILNTPTPGSPSPVAKLAAPIDAHATTLELVAPLPAAAQAAGEQFHALIDSEWVVIPTQTGTELTGVIRGAEGSTAASHGVRAGIYPVLTKEALENFIATNVPTSVVRDSLVGGARQLNTTGMTPGQTLALSGDGTIVPADPIPPTVAGISVLDHGIKADGIWFGIGGASVAMTAGSAEVVGTDTNFTQADVGKSFSVQGPLSTAPDGTTITSTIISVQDATHCTLAHEADTTSGGGFGCYGTDDAPALNALLASSTCTPLFLPSRADGQDRVMVLGSTVTFQNQAQTLIGAAVESTFIVGLDGTQDLFVFSPTCVVSGIENLYIDFVCNQTAGFAIRSQSYDTFYLDRINLGTDVPVRNGISLEGSCACYLSRILMNASEQTLNVNSDGVTVFVDSCKLYGGPINVDNFDTDLGGVFISSSVQYSGVTGAMAAGVRRGMSFGSGQTTVGAAGAASALPATPSRYITITGDDGNQYVIPAYAVS